MINVYMENQYLIKIYIFPLPAIEKNTYKKLIFFLSFGTNITFQTYIITY